MRFFAFVSCLSIACGHAAPRPVAHATEFADVEAKAVDGHAWGALANALCREAGGVEYGDISFSLARQGFFDEKDGRLREAAVSWIGRVAATFAKLPKGATLVTTTTLEDQAATLPLVSKTAIANQRAAAIHDALVSAGVDPARLVVHTTTKNWEGDYDGPAGLDPTQGRVDFAVTR